MSKNILRICVIVFLALFVADMTGCRYLRPKHEQVGMDEEEKQRVAEEKEAIVKADKKRGVTELSTDVRISAVPKNLVPCATGEVNAYRIARDSEIFPGPMANAAPGDYVLQNDILKVGVTRPNSDAETDTGNRLIDVVHKKNNGSADYFESFEMVPDLETTETAFSWKNIEIINDPKFDAYLKFNGCLVQYEVDSSQTTPVIVRKDRTDIPTVTTWTLRACSNVLDIKTLITNNSSETITLLPGDIVKPGNLQTFIEGYGFIRGAIETKVAWASALVDDFSLGLVNYTQRKVEGVFGPSIWFVRQFGDGPFNSPYFERKKAKEPTVPQEKDADFHKFGVSGEDETLKLKGNAPRQDMNDFKDVLEKMKLENTNPPPTESTYESKGGGIENELQTTPTLRLVLDPGTSYTYHRALIISDADMARILYEMVRVKLLDKTNIVAGTVLERQTQKAIQHADVLISGGPGWDGKGESRPYIITKTNENGVFAMFLPEGQYELIPQKAGRIVISKPVKLTVSSTDSKLNIANLFLSKESIMNVAVADGDKPVNVGIPCKLTILTRSSVKPFEFPYTGNIELGVRNTIYLPDGATRFPLTPGKYQFVISRGIEYEAINKDVEVTPESVGKQLFKMKRVVPVEDMLSVDAAIVTTASASSILMPPNAVVMAACEGVHAIISGDYGKATDLQPYVAAYGYEKILKALRGMRFLVGGYSDNKADIWVFPVRNDEEEASLQEFYVKNFQSEPDLFIKNLKETYPGLYIQINDVLDARRGYLSKAMFDDKVHLVYDETTLPPPDFDGIQIMEKGLIGYFWTMKDRFFDLQNRRLTAEDAGVLSPVAFSGSSLPFNAEIGYPRMYVRVPALRVAELSYDLILSAFQKQRYIITNGPILNVAVLDPVTGEYNKLPGSVIDYGTTNVLKMKLHIMSAPWIDVQNINIYYNGRMKRSAELTVRESVVKYPDPNVKRAPNTGVVTYGPLDKKDSVLNVLVSSSRKSLSPIVSSRPQYRNSELWPIAWIGPIYLDENGDGKIGSTKASVDDAQITSLTQEMLKEYYD